MGGIADPIKSVELSKKNSVRNVVGDKAISMGVTNDRKGKFLSFIKNINAKTALGVFQRHAQKLNVGGRDGGVVESKRCRVNSQIILAFSRERNVITEIRVVRRQNVID